MIIIQFTRTVVFATSLIRRVDEPSSFGIREILVGCLLDLPVTNFHHVLGNSVASHSIPCTEHRLYLPYAAICNRPSLVYPSAEKCFRLLTSFHVVKMVYLGR